MIAKSALLLCVLRPMESLAGTILAEIACKRFDFQEAKKREELADSILHGGSRQTPLVR